MSSVGCRLLLAKGWRVTVSGVRATDLVALVEEYLRTLNEHDLDAWAELLDPEIELEIDSLTLHGVDAVLRFAKQIEQTFPGIVSEIVRVVATSGDSVVCEARPVNPNTDQDDQDAWYLEGVSCMIFEFREGRVARLRNYYAPSPNDRTAQSNVPSRFAAAKIVDEQAALRRVATLVAQGVAPSAVFDAVTREVATLLDVSAVALARFDGDLLTVVAASGSAPRVRVGQCFPLAGTNVSSTVLRTGRTARLDDFAQATGPIADFARGAGVGSVVAAPVVVEGRTWGSLAAIWTDRGPPPDDTEERMAGFAQLLDTAIATADSREQLAASRARVLAAGDEARRRVVRDLHDGAQQRLVHTIVTLKLAQRTLHLNPSDAEALVAEALSNAERATAELRELAHGILPSVLTRGGLRAAVKAFVSGLDLPVEVDVSDERLPPDIAASAYFIVAEALTNVVKHARATRATVRAAVDGGVLTVEVRDDGAGGANPDGHGLLGIADRVDALGGRLQVESRDREGTVLAVTLPLSTR